jgi:DNA-binding HxlR family transcriptional regulator
MILDRVADKWTALTVAVLSGGTLRFGELRRAVTGISEKMLSQTLRGLERDGLVERRVVTSTPIKVEYSLTPLGRTLVEPLAALCDWAERHGPDVVAAQDAHDTAAHRKP